MALGWLFETIRVNHLRVKSRWYENIAESKNHGGNCSQRDGAPLMADLGFTRVIIESDAKQSDAE
jgi:hypothetical protein